MSAGNILVTRLIVREAVDLVTDGVVRDYPEIAARPFPVFTAGRSASIGLSAHHAVDFDVPIACAGDVLIGDAEGASSFRDTWRPRSPSRRPSKRS